MPNVKITLPNVNESVFRPLVADLVEQIQELTNLNFVNDIRFLNYGGATQLPDSSVTDKKARYATFASDNRIWIEAEEDYNQDGWSSSITDRPEHYPLFLDKALGVYITPIIIPSDLILKMKFGTNSQDEARRWRDDIAMRLAALREGYQHTLTFSINLPTVIWELVEDIWKAREAVKGYGQDLDEYIKEHADNDLTIVSESSGTQRSLAYRRRMNRINGRFDISPLPEKPTYDEAGGIWECSLTYKITYDRPMGCLVRYPIMVHNQFLPDRYITPGPSPYDYRDVAKKRSVATQALSYFETIAINGYNSNQDAYMRVPSIDDYVFPMTPKGTATYFLGLLQLENETISTLLNLSELGSIYLDEDVLLFIKEVEFVWLNKPYQSFLGMQFYRDDNLMHPETISCLSNLNIIPNETLNLRETYRIRLSLVVDPTLLPFAAFERLRKYPKAMIKILAAINEALRYNVDLNNLGEYRALEPWMMTRLWQMLNGFMPLPQSGVGRGLDRFLSGNLREIPDWAIRAITRSPQMRTVQIQGTIVQNK